jgi:hypothetical protein
MPSGAEEHRRVAVMPAGMHLARNRRLVWPLRRLRHRKRVHIGAQSDPPRAVADLQRADDAGTTEAAMHTDAGFLEQFRHDRAGAFLLEAEFRMRVQVTAQGGEERQIGFDLGGNAHGSDNPVSANGARRAGLQTKTGARTAPAISSIYRSGQAEIQPSAATATRFP